MTPEQEAVLHEIDKKVSNIETVCTGCQETLTAHDLMLHGRPGNAKNPGLSSRTLVLEQRTDVVEKSQEKSVKWLRAQLGAMIAAMLAALAVLGRWLTRE